MTRAIFVAISVAIWGCALAQNDALQGLPSVSAERAAIESSRARESAKFDAMEAECYQRFAVNSCLSKVHSQRRAMLSEIKRQEQVLNDAERMQRGAAQIRLNEEKAQEKLQKDLEAARTDNAAAQAERQKAQDDKRLNHATDAKNASSAPRTQPTPAVSVDNVAARAAYERKQQEALKRRADAEKRQRDKATSTAAKPLKPLPIAP
jgi:hypothetical protein